MNALISTTIVCIIALVAVPTIYYIFNVVPAIIDFIDGFINWHTR